MEEQIIVSIVICTRNRSAQLEGTLRSLASIRSNYAWEALLVDNASTDDTATVIKQSYDCGGRLRYVYVDRIGLGAARDAAWRQAYGSLIAFTDDDCYVAEDYVDALVDVFRQHPETGCVGGRIMLYDPQDEAATIDERNEPMYIAPFQFVEAGALQGANISLRREVLERIDGFDPDLGAGTPFPCEDIDVLAACLWSGISARFDPAPVVWHDHGRRKEHLHKLFLGYDRGRGAYYAKYLLRKDTRKAYMRGWWNVAKHNEGKRGIVRLTREMGAGYSYLRYRGANRFLAAAAPVATLGYIIVTSLVFFRLLRKELYSLVKSGSGTAP